MGRSERRKLERMTRLEENKATFRVKPSEYSQMKKKIREETSAFNVDVLMTCYSLAAHRICGLDVDQCSAILEEVDSMMGAINDGTATMKDYIQALKDEVDLEIVTIGGLRP